MDSAAEFLLTVIAILAVSLVLAISPAIHLSSLGAGKHTGFITAVEQEGYIFPNYRVYVKPENVFQSRYLKDAMQQQLDSLPKSEKDSK